MLKPQPKNTPSPMRDASSSSPPRPPPAAALRRPSSAPASVQCRLGQRALADRAHATVAYRERRVPQLARDEHEEVGVVDALRELIDLLIDRCVLEIARLAHRMQPAVAHELVDDLGAELVVCRQ